LTFDDVSHTEPVSLLAKRQTEKFDEFALGDLLEYIDDLEDIKAPEAFLIDRAQSLRFAYFGHPRWPVSANEIDFVLERGREYVAALLCGPHQGFASS